MSSEPTDQLVQRLLKLSESMREESLPREIKIWIIEECKLRGIPEEEAIQALEWYCD